MLSHRCTYVAFSSGISSIQINSRGIAKILEDSLFVESELDENLEGVVLTCAQKGEKEKEKRE